MLTVRDLSIVFNRYDVGLKRKELKVITRLDLDVKAGELVAVIGSSGSGKSLLAHAILGILPSNARISGEIIYKDEPLTPEMQKRLRGRYISLIPQSVGYLDTLKRIGKQVRRAAVLSGLDKKAAGIAQKRAFERYDLKERDERLFPFQVSGGMARRVLMASATVGQASLIIADEPTPGLHPEIVKETLDHLRELANEGKGLILITHDIEAALSVADKIAVFYAGTTVEEALASDFTGGGEMLRHPYTKALWKALPQNDFHPFPGVQPSPGALPQGCLFADRCPIRMDECHTKIPDKKLLRNGFVRCINA